MIETQYSKTNQKKANQNDQTIACTRILETRLMMMRSLDDDSV
jgi:hypothetical protein